MTLIQHNPYAQLEGMQWLKGEIHLHTSRHGGRGTRDEMLARLRDCGFCFAALSDHNLYGAPDETGAPLLLGNAEMRTQGGDILSLFADITPGYPGPDAPPGDFPPAQTVIDRIRAAGGLPILAHPKIAEFTGNARDWTFTSAQLVADLTGYAGMEVYTHYLRSGFQSAVDRLDAVWIHRWRQGLGPAPIWGYATSDAHGPEDISPLVGIMVAAPRLELGALRQALAAGRFYSLAATQARLREISIASSDAEGEVLSVVVEGCEMLALYGVPQESRRGDRRLLALAWADGAPWVQLRHTIHGGEGYLRLEGLDRHGGHLYLNPIALVSRPTSS